MKVLKKIIDFCPAFLTFFIVVWCITCIIGGTLEKDDFFVGAFFFHLLLPMCAFISGLWYGPKIKSRKKWIIAIIFGIIEITLFSVPFGYIGFGYIVSILLIFIQIMTCTIIGIMLGECIVKYKNKRKYNILEKVVFNVINSIIIIITAIISVLGTLYITSIININYELIDEDIKDKPQYKNDLPPLWNAIEEFEVPNGYIKENVGSNKSYENILRDNNKDEQVLISITLEDYKGLNNVKLSDIIRFRVYENGSKKEVKKWLNSVKIITNNDTKIYKDDKNIILYKDGTYIFATLEPGTLIPTEKDKRVFNQIVNSIVIK